MWLLLNIIFVGLRRQLTCTSLWFGLLRWSWLLLKILKQILYFSRVTMHCDLYLILCSRGFIDNLRKIAGICYVFQKMLIILIVRTSSLWFTEIQWLEVVMMPVMSLAYICPTEIETLASFRFVWVLLRRLDIERYWEKLLLIFDWLRMAGKRCKSLFEELLAVVFLQFSYDFINSMNFVSKDTNKAFFREMKLIETLDTSLIFSQKLVNFLACKS